MIRDLFTSKGVDTIFRTGHRPMDLDWNTQLDEPEVIQLTFGNLARITWNPDNNRFYVEQKSLQGDWITVVTRACNDKGWHNAKYTARHLLGDTR